MSEAVIKLFSNQAAKKRITFFLKVFVSTVFTYLIFNYIDIREVSSAFLATDIYLILVVVSLGFLNIYLQFLKWKLICNSYLGEAENKNILKSLFIGFASGIVTPARTGEFAGRAYPFKNSKILDITIATFLDKIFSLSVIFVLGLFSMIYLFGEKFFFKADILILILAGLVLTLLIIFLYQRQKIFKVKIPFVKKITSKISHLKNLERAVLYKMIFLSAAFVLVYLVQFALLIGAFTSSNNYAIFFVVGTGVMFIKTFLIPFGFGDLGVREGTTVFLLSLFGFSGAAGFNASILLFTINLLIPSLIGLLYFFKK